ncbi:hypothetical protein R1sor_021253 [Riccia sorocarpa]|uniref:Uncharacterized protein n=1 Tax=Riccia sorocarpa TaxID=122646 RepID=A0ABD3GIC8_9MARC
MEDPPRAKKKKTPKGKEFATDTSEVREASPERLVENDGQQENLNQEVNPDENPVPDEAGPSQPQPPSQEELNAELLLTLRAMRETLGVMRESMLHNDKVRVGKMVWTSAKKGQKRPWSGASKTKT